jgi:hypothetical protein
MDCILATAEVASIKRSKIKQDLHFSDPVTVFLAEFSSAIKGAMREDTPLTPSVVTNAEPLPGWGWDARLPPYERKLSAWFTRRWR